MTSESLHWGRALRRHVSAAGVKTNKELSSRVGAGSSTVSRWFGADVMPVRLQVVHEAPLCVLLALDGRDELKRLPLIEPRGKGHLSAPADESGRVAWSDINPLIVPNPLLVSALFLKGVKTTTVDQVIEELKDAMGRTDAAMKEPKE